LSNKEIRLKHEDIKNPQTITGVTKKAFAENDLNIHQHEVDSLEDDFSKGERVLSIRKKQYFTVGDIPWHK
jgi:hypothetical protein